MFYCVMRTVRILYTHSCVCVMGVRDFGAHTCEFCTRPKRKEVPRAEISNGLCNTASRRFPPAGSITEKRKAAARPALQRSPASGPRTAP